MGRASLAALAALGVAAVVGCGAAEDAAEPGDDLAADGSAELEDAAGDAVADRIDGDVDDDHVDDDHVDDHGLPDPEPLPAIPALDEHELAGFVDPDVAPALRGEPGDVQAMAAPSNCEKVKVVNTGGATLRVRPDPSTQRAALGSLDAGQVADVHNAVTGETVNGVSRWYEVQAGSLRGFVSGAYTACIDVAPTVRFKLPLRCDRSARVTQGNSGSYSHNGTSRYAFDFGLPRGTPLVAIAAGRVVARRGSTRPGDPCWSGGGPACASKANYVVLQHDDGSQSVYAHLDSPSVALGDRVARGDVVGRSGGTGYSTGPHAHVARQQNCGSTFCQTIETRFVDVDVHGGIPRTGETVTSGNCP